MTADYLHSEEFWRGGWETIANALANPHFWWLFAPLLSGILIMAAARLLPDWRRLRLTLCFVGLLACVSLAWNIQAAQILTPWGLRFVGLGTAIMLIAILMQVAGEDAQGGA